MALTKKISISDEALHIIAGMTWAEEYDGRVIGTLNAPQLARPLYLEVNKGLEALGGKWDRRVKGHVFPTDPRPQLADLLDNGYVVKEKDGFFETPRAVTAQMLRLVGEFPHLPILEPSAGLGAIADTVCEMVPGVRPVDIHCCEKNPQRLEVLRGKGYWPVVGNFLDFRPYLPYPTILMNPPFEEGQDVAHVTHAFDYCLAEKGILVSVMSAGVLFRQDYKYRQFRELVNQHGNFEELPPGSFKESGTGVNACLAYLRK